jgi:hypothetical protein
VHDWPTKLPLKSSDEELLLFSVQAGLQSSKHHKMAPLRVLG